MNKDALVIIIIIFVLSLFVKMTPITPYDKYRNWFDKDIAFEINHQLKRINKKIVRKEVKPEDYVELAFIYEKLFKEAIKKETENEAHQHLILYLKYRKDYYIRYSKYLENRDQMVKAQLNNVYDDGNIEYQLFLDGIEKWSEKQNEKFEYQFILY
ncbi:MAG TPA: hypothetical protein VEV44_16270 [Pseudoneobacillus sp.]|nr:hypothetical protein [Pseudoneobacillus sp.]